MTDYYVNSAADPGGDGTTQATSGANCAWDAVADVNAASLSGDDNVYFNKGNEWREQLTPHSVGSGTSGHPITYGSYGSGAAPIINGADLVTSWSNLAGAAADVDTQTSSNTFQSFRYNSGWTWGAQSWTTSEAYDVYSVKLKLTKIGSPTGNMWVEIYSDSPGDPNAQISNGQSDNLDVSTFTGTPTDYEFLFSGTKPSVSTSTRYWIVFKADYAVSSSNYVRFYYDNGDPLGSELLHRWDGGAWVDVAGWDAYFKVRKLAATTIYYATLNTECHRVWHASTELTENAGNYASLGSDEWDWDTNKLYVNIGSDPTSETIEATQRDDTVYIREADYICLDGLHITKSDTSGITQWSGQSVGCEIKNSTIDYCAANGIIFADSNGGDDWHIHDNTISENGVDSGDHGIYFEAGINSTIENNTFDGNYGYAIQLQDNSDDNIVRYNWSTNHGSGFLVNYDNAGGAGPTGNQVYYNISVDDDDGIGVGGSAYNASMNIYNNVIYNPTVYGLDITDGATVGNFKNNIIWSAGTHALYDANGAAVITSNYNCIGPEAANYINWGGTQYSTLAAYVAGETQDANSIKDDPLFISP